MFEVKTASPYGFKGSRNNIEIPGLLAWATWRLGWYSPWKKVEKLGTERWWVLAGTLRCLWDPRVEMSLDCWVCGSGIQMSNKDQSHWFT